MSTRASAPTMGAEEGGGASGDFRIEPLEIGRRDNNGGVTERGRGGGGVVTSFRRKAKVINKNLCTYHELFTWNSLKHPSNILFKS